MKRKDWKYYLWHSVVGVFTIASIVEVFTGFLPFSNAQDTNIKIFFMGLTLIGTFYEIINHLIESFSLDQDLMKKINTGLTLSKEQRIESSVLKALESNLDDSFNVKSGNYHIIIITSCLKLNEKEFIEIIWNNIKNLKCKYLYITPDTDQFFIDLLICELKEKFPNENLKDIYCKVLSSISHIYDERIFKVLPNYYDMCIYCKDINGKINIESAKGFVCYQNEPIKAEKISYDYYFYQKMGYKELSKLFNIYSNEFENNHLINSYYDKKVEVRPSLIHGNGLFCKQNKRIEKNEIVIIKGGWELHKEELFSSKVINSYLQIDEGRYLGAKSEDEEEKIKIPINHSCEPNVYMLNERTFAALKKINSGEELTIDYAFVDNDTYSFKCNCNSSCCRNTIRGDDWKLANVQKKYNKRCFSPYIKRIMKK